MDSVVETKQTLVVEAFDDALLIWDEDAGKLHHLEAVATAVWAQLDGQQSLRTVSDGLTERYAGDPEQIRGDVLTLVYQLRDEGLVALSKSSPRLRP